MKTKRTVIIIILTLFFLSVAISIHARAAGQESESGLIGILFNDSDFKRPISLWPIQLPASQQMKWPKFNDFSAQWQGTIEAPGDGSIAFYAEADDGVRLEIDGKIVLDSWDEKTGNQGSIEMKAGNLYPLQLYYRQISGSSFMRLYWAWNETEKQLIPASVLHFSKEDKEAMQEVIRNKAGLPDEDLSFNISSILTINNQTDVENRRRAFSDFLFGAPGFPSQKGVDDVKTAIHDEEFSKLKNLHQIDRLEINMEFGLNSIAYHFIPLKANNKVVLYHQGHGGEFSRGMTTIQGLLARGYHVVGFSMPLKGMNSKPVVDLKRFGKMFFNSHERMRFLDPAQGHPVKYFVEPVFRVINYLQNKGFTEIYMTGLSGGGWTTTLCAAMDTRIKRSYPVAGSLPIYLRIRDPKNGSWGDYEQVVPELYRIANYLELYVLGASGPGRRQIQMLNEFDSCCFSGRGFKTYQLLVQERVKSIGRGYYDVFLDSSHEEHKISEKALAYILEDLEK